MTSYILGTIRTTQIEQMLDTIPNTTHKAIFVGTRIPESYQSLNKFILIYRLSPITPPPASTPTSLKSCEPSGLISSLKPSGNIILFAFVCLGIFHLYVNRYVIQVFFLGYRLLYSTLRINRFSVISESPI